MCTKHIACVLESSYLKMAHSSLFVFFLNNQMAPAISWEIPAGDAGQRLGCDEEEFQAKTMRRQLEGAS